MIADKLQQVHARVAQACASARRRVDSVTLLTVSKTFGPNSVREAVAAGEWRFGENYVQEGVDKIAALADLRSRLEWHLIGPLQSNKTRVVAEQFDWVHSVDRLKIAQRLSEQRPAHLPPLQICLQVNIDRAASKSGLMEEDVSGVARAVSRLPRLTLRGLMAIPEAADDVAATARAPGGFARAVAPSAARGLAARHLVDGHERRPRSGDCRGRDHRARRHCGLRGARAYAAGDLKNTVVAHKPPPGHSA